MKRRNFIKALGALLASSLFPSGPSGAHSVEKAIPDPDREKNLYFRHDGSSYEAHKPEPTHIHDALRYAISARGVSGDDMLNGQEEYLGYYSGLQWTKAEQRELNKRRSKIVVNRTFPKVNQIIARGMLKK